MKHILSYYYETSTVVQAVIYVHTTLALVIFRKIFTTKLLVDFIILV